MTVRLVDRNWGHELSSAASSHTTRLQIVCPFMKAPAVDNLLSSTTTDRIEVITRFNLADFGSGVSDIAALKALLKAGARIRGVRGLHAKVFIFGGSRAAVTSANLTTAAFTRNREFGCVSDDRNFVAACQVYFDDLWSHAGDDLVAPTLDEWESRIEEFLSAGGRRGSEADLPDLGSFTTLQEPPMSDGQDSNGGWIEEYSNARVKFFGEGHNRARWSLPTLDEVRRSGCHWAGTYPTGRRPRSVQDGDILFMARMVENPNDMAIYGRAIAMRHVPGRDDASEAELAERPWKSQWSHYVRVHHAEFIAGTLRNSVALSTLMDTLRSDAFATTQEHAREGRGNVNPRRALRQQPGVRLSSDGAAWLNGRFEQALAISGALPEDDLAQLDWPSQP